MGIEAQYNIGQIVQKTQAMFQVNPETPIGVDPSGVTWAKLQALLDHLDVVTAMVEAEAGAMMVQGVPGISHVQGDLHAWQERLVRYEDLVELGLEQNPADSAAAYEQVGLPLLHGVREIENPDGTVRVIDTIPDFATPFILANMLHTAEGFYHEMHDRFFDHLAEDIRESAGELADDLRQGVEDSVDFGMSLGNSVVRGFIKGVTRFPMVALALVGVGVWVWRRKK